MISGDLSTPDPQSPRPYTSQYKVASRSGQPELLLLWPKSTNLLRWRISLLPWRISLLQSVHISLLLPDFSATLPNFSSSQPNFSSALGFILRSSGIPSTEEKYDRRREIRQQRFVLFGHRTYTLYADDPLTVFVQFPDPSKISTGISACTQHCGKGCCIEHLSSKQHNPLWVGRSGVGVGGWGVAGGLVTGRVCGDYATA